MGLAFWPFLSKLSVVCSLLLLLIVIQGKIEGCHGNDFAQGFWGYIWKHVEVLRSNCQEVWGEYMDEAKNAK